MTHQTVYIDLISHLQLAFTAWVDCVSGTDEVSAAAVHDIRQLAAAASRKCSLLSPSR